VHDWLEQGMMVVQRAVINGSGGAGITLLHPEEFEPDIDGDWTVSGLSPSSPLWTLFRPRQNWAEYRAYVVDKKVVGLAQKKRYNRDRLIENDIDPDNYHASQIKTHANGWVFARNNITGSEDNIRRLIHTCEDIAVRLNLGVGGIDVLMNSSGGIEFLESNTSIALNSQRTVDEMTNAIIEVHDTISEFGAESNEQRA
jgi:hypothetical protein